MLSVRLCQCSKGDPLESFVESTTSVYSACSAECKHAGCKLSIVCDNPCYLKVEAEGKTVFQSAIDAKEASIPLSEIFKPQEESSIKILAALLKHHAVHKQEAPDEFSVFITEGGKDGRLVATYHFKLLAPSEFNSCYCDHLESYRADGR
jgi:hypothetical protein